MELFRAHGKRKENCGQMISVNGKICSIFSELMDVVIGNEHYDWDAFEQSAKYKNGYTSGDPTVSAK